MNLKYKTYKNYECEACKHNHEKINHILNDNGIYLKCEKCNHCAFISSFTKLTEATIEHNTINRLKHDPISLNSNNFIPYGRTDSIVSGFNEDASSHVSWLNKISQQGRNTFSGRVLGIEDPILEAENHDYIDFCKLMESLEKDYGLQDHRQILTIKNENTASEYIKKHYPHINYHDFCNKNIEHYNEEEMKAYINIQSEKKEQLRNNHKKVESDFWLVLLKKYKNISNGSYLELRDFTNLSNWNKVYWAHISMIDNLTKGHPSRNGSDIKFSFKW